MSDTSERAARWLAAILVLALVVRLGFAVVIYPRMAHSFALELRDPYDSIAVNVLAGHGYVEHPNEPPSLRLLPLYPLLLAAIFAVAGPSLWVVQVVQALLASLTCLVIFLLARRLYERTPIALAAAALIALHPAFVQYASRYYSETLYMLLLALFVATATVALTRERVAHAAHERAADATAEHTAHAAGSVRDVRDAPDASVYPAHPSASRLWAISGLCFGLATLTRGNAALLPLPLALLMCRRIGGRRTVRALAAFAAAAAVVILPWSAYASRLAGSPVPLTTWSAAPLYHGLYVSRRVTTGRPLADLDKEASQQLGAAVGPSSGLSPADQVRRERAAMALIKADLRAHPAATALTCVRGLAVVWFWARTRWTIALYLLVHAPLLVLAAIGLRRVPARAEVGPLVLTVCWFWVQQGLGYPQARYVLPVVPLLAIPAAAAAFGRSARRTTLGPPGSGAAFHAHH